MLTAGGARAASAGTSDIPTGVHPDRNQSTCLAGSTEICVGVNSSGNTIENVQIQAKLPTGYSGLTYHLVGDDGFSAVTTPFSAGPGWAWQWTDLDGRTIASGSYTMCGYIMAGGTDLNGTCVFFSIP